MSSFSTICIRPPPRARRADSVGREGDEGQNARSLDRLHQLALVPGTGSGDPARENLGPLRRKRLEQPDVLVIDELDLLVAELAELLLPEQKLLLVLFLAAAVLPAPSRLPRFPHALSCDRLRAPWVVRPANRRAPGAASSSVTGPVGARSRPAPPCDGRFARSSAAVDPAP